MGKKFLPGLLMFMIVICLFIVFLQKNTRKAKFDSLAIGTAKEEVIKILGEPTLESSVIDSLTWTHDTFVLSGEYPFYKTRRANYYIHFSKGLIAQKGYELR